MKRKPQKYKAKKQKNNSSEIRTGYLKPKRTKSPIERFNQFLIFILLALAACSFACYYSVSNSERRMNQLGKDINALNAENMELQNKIDNMHSFNKVDDFIKNSSAFNTAKKTIEIEEAPELSDEYPPKPAVKFRWSAGY